MLSQIVLLGLSFCIPHLISAIDDKKILNDLEAKGPKSRVSDAKLTRSNTNENLHQNSNII